MSFLTNVDGLNEVAHNGAGFDMTGLSSFASFSCVLGETSYLCEGGGIGDFSGTVDITDIPYDTTRDYYAVRLVLEGPKLAGAFASCEEPPLPGLSPCDGVSGAFYDGTVSGGPFVTFNAVSLAPTFSAAPETFGGNTCQVNWPDNNPALSWLVNESPVWPVGSPGSADAEGNLFGGLCLFTLAQLAALPPITVDLDYYDHHQLLAGRFGVSVREYVVGETVAPVAIVDVIGEA